MNNLLNILLMAPAKEGQNPSSFFFMMILIVVIFYFFMIRPQVKRQKDLKNYRESLKKGDKIITSGGIYGKINDISGNVITIEIEDKVRMKVDKSAILKDPSDLAKQK